MRRLYNMAYKDPEKEKEYRRKYYQENREKEREANRKYHKENKEKIKAYSHNRYQENKEKIKEQKRKWREKNPEKRNASAAKRRSSKLQRTPDWVSEDDFFMIKESYSLAKLREKTTGIKWHVDHIIPLQGKTVSGLHVPNNLQVIPEAANCSKHNNWNWDDQR
jgi:aconitase A